MVAAGLEAQLAHEAMVEARNRKRLRANPIAPWELRVRDMRVFDELDEPGVVTVLAIGRKRGSRLCIEGEEIQL
jgi:hypothetical protein